MANAAKRANFHTRTPSAKLRFGPKKRVMKATTSSGTSVPAMAWRIATFRPIMARKSVQTG